MNRIKKSLGSKNAQIIAKLSLFGVLVVWEFVFLGAGLAFLGSFLTRFKVLAEPDLVHQGILDFLTVWYVLTLVVIGIWVANKAFNLVLKWERSNGGN